MEMAVSLGVLIYRIDGTATEKISHCFDGCLPLLSGYFFVILLSSPSKFVVDDF